MGSSARFSDGSRVTQDNVRDRARRARGLPTRLLVALQRRTDGVASAQPTSRYRRERRGAASAESLTREQYDEVNRRLEGAVKWPPDGLDMHVLFGPEGDMRVSEIWDSEEQFRAFADHLMPASTRSASRTRSRRSSR